MLGSMIAARRRAYLPQSERIFTAFGSRPDVARCNIIDDLVKRLISSGVWGTLDLLYVGAASSLSAASINWVNPGQFSLSVVGTPTFAADSGWTTPNSALSYYDTAWDAATNAVKLSQNDAHIGGWTIANGTGSGGFFGTISAAYLQVNNEDNAGGRITSSSSITKAAGARTGYIVGARRSDAANVVFSLDGAATSSHAAASSALSSVDVCIGIGNSSPSSGTTSLVHLGSQLSDAQIASAYSAFQTYLRSVGAI